MEEAYPGITIVLNTIYLLKKTWFALDVIRLMEKRLIRAW
jgi:hypothetical protein